jgi:hypothetical protein
METKKAIIYAVFLAGVAVFYDTRETCNEVAAIFTGADVREVYSFADMETGQSNDNKQ